MTLDLERLDNWRERLEAEMERQRRTPFEWGKHDCAIGFAGGVVRALTGKDLARGKRGSYSAPASALRALRDHGAESLGDLAAIWLPELKNKSKAQVGDIGVIASDGPGGEAFAMVDVSGLIVLTPEGLSRPLRATPRPMKASLIT